MGVQASAVAPVSAIVCSRCAEVMPPVTIAIAPTSCSPSLVAQKCTWGPNEKASATRSSAPMPIRSKLRARQARHHAQSSAVSSTRSGGPVVPLVWCIAT